MAEPTGYRAFILDQNDRIIKRYDFEAENTIAALELAQQYVDGHDVEVWQGPHIIGRLNRTE